MEWAWIILIVVFLLIMSLDFNKDRLDKDVKISEYSKIDFVTHILCNDDWPNIKRNLYKRYFNKTNCKGLSPFSEAIVTRNYGKLKTGIKYSDVNQKNKDSSTPLILAIGLNYTDIAEYLIKNGANVNLTEDTDGLSPLHFAAIKRNEYLIDILLRYGANADASSFSGITPLMIAARLNDINTIKKLIQKGANIQKENALGETAISIAQALGFQKITEFLEEKNKRSQKKSVAANQHIKKKNSKKSSGSKSSKNGCRGNKSE